MDTTKETPSLDTMDVYLNQIGENPLLTPEEETELTLSLRAGTEAEHTLKQSGDLSADEVAELEVKVNTGEAAKTKLIVSNLRLVVAWAKKHQHKGLPLPDLIQEGYFGLVRAIEKFDPDTGNKLSTYATIWINQAIDRAVAASGKSLRISADRNDTIATLERTKEVLLQKGKTNPSIAEISDASGLDERQVQTALRINNLLNIASLNAPVGEDDATFGDFVPDSGVSPEEPAISSEYNDWLQTWLDTHLEKVLTEEERTIIRFRYGLNGNDKKSPTQIAKVLRIRGKERWEIVRKKEADALKKIMQSIIDETRGRRRQGDEVDEEIAVRLPNKLLRESLSNGNVGQRIGELVYASVDREE